VDYIFARHQGKTDEIEGTADTSLTRSSSSTLSDLSFSSGGLSVDIRKEKPLSHSSKRVTQPRNKVKINKKSRKGKKNDFYSENTENFTAIRKSICLI